RRTRFDENGELRLPARALQIYDQRSGDISNEVRTMVVFDERQRQVDAGRNPGRGVDVAVAHEDRVRFDADSRIGTRQQTGVPPMGSRTTAVERSGLRQDERPR